MLNDNRQVSYVFTKTRRPYLSEVDLTVRVYGKKRTGHSDYLTIDRSSCVSSSFVYRSIYGLSPYHRSLKTTGTLRNKSVIKTKTS